MDKENLEILLNPESRVKTSKFRNMETSSHLIFDSIFLNSFNCFKEING